MGHILSAALSQLKTETAGGKSPETFWGFTFGFLFFLAVLALFFGFLERRFPENAAQPPVSLRRLRPGGRLDLGYWLLDHVADKVIGLLLIPAVVFAIILRIPHLTSPLAHQPLPLQAIEVIVIADFVGYWVHRAFHASPRLWGFHAVHHSSPILDWLAGGRAHPVETLLSKMIQASVIFWLGFSLQATAAFTPVLALYAIILHANLRWDYGPLRWVIASPAYHRWHHSSDVEARGKNFAGFLPAIDLLFGTAYLPRGAKPESFGITDAFPETLREQLRAPFGKTA